MSFAPNVFHSYPIVAKLCPEHDNITAMHCIQLQTIGLKRMLRTNEIVRDLGKRYEIYGMLTTDNER